MFKKFLKLFRPEPEPRTVMRELLWFARSIGDRAMKANWTIWLNGEELTEHTTGAGTHHVLVPGDTVKFVAILDGETTWTFEETIVKKEPNPHE